MLGNLPKLFFRRGKRMIALRVARAQSCHADLIGNIQHMKFMGGVRMF